MKLIDEVRMQNYAEISRMLVEEAMPFYKLWVEIENDYTGGDGYLDKLCMELIGLPSSRCRPPTRDIRKTYRTQTYDMMKKIKTPRLQIERRQRHRTARKLQSNPTKGDEKDESKNDEDTRSGSCN